MRLFTVVFDTLFYVVRYTMVASGITALTDLDHFSHTEKLFQKNTKYLNLSKNNLSKWNYDKRITMMLTLRLPVQQHLHSIIQRTGPCNGAGIHKEDLICILYRIQSVGNDHQGNGFGKFLKYLFQQLFR